MWDITEGFGWSKRQLPRRPGAYQTPVPNTRSPLFRPVFGTFWCSLFDIMYISSLNVSSSKRSHPNICLFIAQLSLLFISCLYCSSFIHNSYHMIQNRLIQAHSSCQTIAVSIRQRVQFRSFIHNCHKLSFRQSGRFTVTCLNCQSIALIVTIYGF